MYPSLGTPGLEPRPEVNYFISYIARWLNSKTSFISYIARWLNSKTSLVELLIETEMFIFISKTDIEIKFSITANYFCFLYNSTSH